MGFALWIDEDQRSPRVAGVAWAISYFLYLPYTVTDIVYEMLVVVFPGIEPWRWLLEPSEGVNPTLSSPVARRA